MRQLNGDSAITEFDRIVLRSGNTRSWAKQDPAHVTFTRDQWFRDSQIAMSGVGSHGTFVHLYLNGLYWGLYNAVERPDASFTSGHLGGERGDWHAVSHHGTLSGDSRRWDYLRGELKNKDMRDPGELPRADGVSRRHPVLRLLDPCLVREAGRLGAGQKLVRRAPYPAPRAGPVFHVGHRVQLERGS